MQRKISITPLNGEQNATKEIDTQGLTRAHLLSLNRVVVELVGALLDHVRQLDLEKHGARVEDAKWTE